MGVCSLFFKSWPFCRPKNVIFHTNFQTWPLGRNQASGIDTIDTFIHSCSSLENHTRFQTKMGKVYTCFHTKTAQKPYPMGQQIRESIEQNSRHTQMITHLNEGARQGRDRLLPLACTLSPQKFKYQHVVWRNPTKRIRKYSNDFRDTVYTRQHVHLRFTYMLLYEIYCGLRKF